MEKLSEWPMEKYARLISPPTEDGKAWETLESSKDRPLILSLTKGGVLKLVMSGLLLEYCNLRQAKDMRVLKRDNSLLFLCRAKGTNRKWRVMFSGATEAVAEERCSQCLRAIHALLPALHSQPLPSSQSHTSQNLPTLQPHTSQSLPPQQPHTSQPLPPLLTHTSQPLPSLLTHTSQPLPTLQPHTNQRQSPLQSHTSQSLHTSQPLPILQPHTSQSLPPLQPHTSQPHPPLQPHTSQPLPPLQAHTSQPLPTLQPYTPQLTTLQANTSQPLPTLQSHTSQPLPPLQPHTSQPLPPLQLHTPQPLPQLQLQASKSLPHPPPPIPLPTHSAQPLLTTQPDQASWSVPVSIQSFQSLSPESPIISETFPPVSTSQAVSASLNPKLLHQNCDIYSYNQDGSICPGTDQLLAMSASALKSQSNVIHKPIGVRPPISAIQFLYQSLPTSSEASTLTGGNVFAASSQCQHIDTATTSVQDAYSKRGKGKPVRNKRARKNSSRHPPNKANKFKAAVWPSNQDTPTAPLIPGNEVSMGLEEIVKAVLCDPQLPDLVDTVHTVITNM